MSKLIKDVSQFLKSSECNLKTLRILEYGSIFLEDLFRSNPNSKSEKKIADDLLFFHKNVRKYRRLLRVFRFISQFYKFKLYYQQQRHSLSKFTVLISKAFKQVYYILDTVQTFMLVFMDTEKFDNLSWQRNTRINTIRTLCWFVGLLIDSVFYIMSIRDSLTMEDQQKFQALNGPLNAKECLLIVESLINERWKIVFLIFSNCTDMLQASHYMGLMKWGQKTQLSKSMEGICGVVCDVSRLRNIIRQFREKKKALAKDKENEDVDIANRFRRIRKFDSGLDEFVSKDNLHNQIRGYMKNQEQSFDDYYKFAID